MTANLENSKRLYELSGWDDTSRYHEEEATLYANSVPLNFESIPAYDCGYLLRKLPVLTNVFKHTHYYTVRTEGGNGVVKQGDTPEDALTLLAIKLFEQGILTKEQK